MEEQGSYEYRNVVDVPERIDLLRRRFYTGQWRVYSESVQSLFDVSQLLPQHIVGSSLLGGIIPGIELRSARHPVCKV